MFALPPGLPAFPAPPLKCSLHGPGNRGGLHPLCRPAFPHFPHRRLSARAAGRAIEGGLHPTCRPVFPHFLHRRLSARAAGRAIDGERLHPTCRPVFPHFPHRRLSARPAGRAIDGGVCAHRAAWPSHIYRLSARPVTVGPHFVPFAARACIPFPFASQVYPRHSKRRRGSLFGFASVLNDMLAHKLIGFSSGDNQSIMQNREKS